MKNKNNEAVVLQKQEVKYINEELSRFVMLIMKIMTL